MFGKLCWQVVLLATCTLSGCAFSVQPLSDETTSVPDLRLLGKWNVSVVSGSGERRSESSGTVTIRRKSGSPKVLEITGNDEGRELSTDLYSIKIGDRDFVSFKPVGLKNGIGPLKNPEALPYCIAGYEVLNDGSISNRPLDLGFLFQAIVSDELLGVKDIETNIRLAVQFKDSPQKLREFIKQHGEKCFLKKPKWTGTSITLKKLE